MTSDLLLEHFHRLAEAPDAIPRLRQFILDLAVRGKLVEQDPKDEPAEELINRVRSKRQRLVKQSVRENDTPTTSMRAAEWWFTVPATWQWARLGEITHVVMGQSPPGESYNKSGDGIPLINGPVEFTAGPFGKTVVNQYTTAPPTNICEEGDLLLCVRGSTTGRTNVAGFRACIGRGVAAIQSLFDDAYVRMFVWSLRESIIEMGRGIAFPSVTRKQIEELPIPLPPLAEQHRIVAKVDELMVLCDRLETTQTERENRRDRLVAASLHCLHIAEDADDFRERARFHLSHLQRFATREGISELRQTILNLAVKGQLVPQDTKNEPAAELLERILAEKERLVRAGNMRKQNQQGEIKPANVSFALPQGWAWARLGDVIHLVSGQHLPPGEYSNQAQNGPPYITGPADFGQNGLVITRYALVRKAVASQGQILLTVKGAGVGKTAICNLPEVAISRQLMALTAIKWNQEFLLLTTHRLAETLRESARSLIPGISRGDVDQFVFALPPLAEQHRIVAKVDQLMALCSALEGQLATAQTESRFLLEAVLHEALETLPLGYNSAK